MILWFREEFGCQLFLKRSVAMTAIPSIIFGPLAQLVVVREHAFQKICHKAGAHGHKTNLFK